MTSTWDRFGQKIVDNSMEPADLTELIEFIRAFDAVNGNIILNGVYRYMKVWNFEFTGWDVFVNRALDGQMSARQMGAFIGYLHDFDHANHEILAVTFSKDRKYWVKHYIYRNFMGTFSDGAWKYSKSYIKLMGLRERAKR